MKSVLKSAWLLFFLAFAACDSKNAYKSFEGLPKLNWEKTNVHTHKVELKEDNLRYKLIVELRHLSSIKYGQLGVRIEHTPPSGEPSTKEYILVLRLPDGSLIGEAMMDLCDTPCLLEEDLALAQGVHTFKIAHIMEEDDLSGIMEVGLILEKIGQ